MLILGHTSVALALTPTVTGNVARPECVDAAALAKSMFYSTASRLYAPLLIPPGMHSTLTLGASELDISGGDALHATDAFEKLPQSTGNRSVYWSREGKAGRRIVIAETPVGWRGDMYSLYSLDATIEKSAFLNSLETPQPNGSTAPIIGNSWRPPLVFQLPDGSEEWFIDVGQPFQILASWNIYSSEATQPICTIEFGELSKDSSLRFPVAVRKLANELDDALGPGRDEGTLQPTATLRLQAKHVLANAAYRPWALSDSDAYNLRSEVEAGLENWAKVRGTRARLRAETLKTYPQAERALTAYYVSRFGISVQESAVISPWVLDLIYRSYFVFPRSVDRPRYDDEIRTNPWPGTMAVPERCAGQPLGL